MRIRTTTAHPVIFLLALFAPATIFFFPANRSAAEPKSTKARAKDSIEVLFSPNGGCTERIVSELAFAKKHIRVQAYSFTSVEIAKAVRDAHRRGIACEVILDKSQKSQQYSELDFFHNQGVPTRIDAQHAIAHNKIILIDDNTIITGSFNFTKAAEQSNAENLLIIKGHPELFARYSANYEDHRKHSEVYKGREQTETKPKPEVGGGDTTKPRPPPKESEDVIVYVTKSGAKYHRAGCGYLRKSSIPMNLSEAKQRYSPCSRCRPPA